MTTRPQDVRLFGLQDRRSRGAATRPWVVRWAVDGRQRSKSFRTKSEADRYRSQLFAVVHAGGRFDERTGLPCAWAVAVAASPVCAWARRWLHEQWPEWQPRTRASAVEALARFLH